MFVFEGYRTQTVEWHKGVVRLAARGLARQRAGRGQAVPDVLPTAGGGRQVHAQA